MLSRLRQLITHPFFFFIIFCVFLYSAFFFSGRIPVPADTLVGSYFPWLDYKWGTTTGVPVKNPPISDVFSQFFAWKYLAMDLLEAGTVPLWNPYMFSGSPLLASYHWAVLFPANLILLLPGYTGWGLYIFSSTLFAGIAMYLFLSIYFKNAWTKVAGSILFSLAGPMTTWTEFGTGVWAAGFLPLIFLVLNKIIVQKKRALYPVLSILIFLLILAGHVQLNTYIAILTPLYVFSLVNQKLSLKSLVTLLEVLFFCLLGILLASPQLLPTLNFFKDSIRSEEKYTSYFRFGLTPWFEYIRLWAADFFGHPSTYNHYSQISYHENSNFLGTITLPFIATTLFFKKRPYFFLIVFFTSLLLASDNPISLWFFSLPLPLFTYSSASRLFFLTAFSAAFLLTYALSNYSFKRLVVLFSSIFLATITLLAIYLTPKEFQTIALRNSLIPLALLTSVCILIFLLKNSKLLVMTILLLLAFDLGRYFLKYNPFVPATYVFPATPVLDYLQSQQGVFRIATTKTNLIPPNTWLPYKLESVAGYDPLRLLSYNRYFSLLNNHPYLSRPSRYAELENFEIDFLSAMNVRYFITLDPTLVDPNNSDLAKLTKSGFNNVFQDKTTIVLENPLALPRAYFAKKTFTATSESQLISLLEDPKFDPQVAIVAQKPVDPLVFDPKSSVDITSYSTQKISLNVNTNTSNLLVISNTYDPGWMAIVDDKPTPVLPINGTFQGIIVSQGQHQVTLSYTPVSFYLGLKIFALTTLALMAIVLYPILKRL